MKHYAVIFNPDCREITIHSGATILEAAAQAGIILNTTCGGAGTCNKCAVLVGPKRKKVQACQYLVESDLTVTIPSESRFYEQQILQHGLEREFDIAPHIHERIPELSEKPHAVYGVAVDIGTTSVVAKLIDLAGGQCRATASAANPQIQYGDDVISRISYASAAPDGQADLHRVIIDCLNTLIDQLCEDADVPHDYIYELTAAGNTTMNHLFLNFPVEQLGQHPYEAYSVDAHDRRPGDLGIKINPEGNIHTIENIAGFVGSDTTAVAVAVGFDTIDEMTLAIDIGTNGEIVLGTKDKMYAASCAAGPALEGARIEQGSRAIDGAIERVFGNDDDIDLDVIGNTTPRSICGSGLIDAVSELIELGVIDTTGRIKDIDELDDSLPQAIAERLTEVNGQPAFILAHNKGSDVPPVILTQKDVRETQLAKAAISAGIKLLQKKVGVTDLQIKHILMAGAFGNYIRRESALRIGLLPNVPPERIRFVGNAASSGARMVLLSSRYRTIANDLADAIEYIEIGHDPDFQMVFADSLLF